MQPLPLLRIRQICPMTAPLILLKLIRQTWFQRISVDIPDKLKRIAVRFNNYWFISPPEKLAITAVLFIISLCINTIQMSHGSGKICIRGLNQEVIMTGHQTIGCNPDIKNIIEFLKEVNKRQIVVLAVKIFSLACPDSLRDTTHLEIVFLMVWT